MANHEPKKLISFPKQDLEVWAKWDDSADVFELFASESGEDYIGCADDLPEARKIAREWAQERAANGI